jgi:hypothetical protein
VGVVQGGMVRQDGVTEAGFSPLPIIRSDFSDLHASHLRRTGAESHHPR